MCDFKPKSHTLIPKLLLTRPPSGPLVEHTYGPPCVHKQQDQDRPVLHFRAWRARGLHGDDQGDPGTARLLQHWGHHKFNGVRPFFCLEAVETAKWLTEVAPQSNNGKRMLDHLALANSTFAASIRRATCTAFTGSTCSPIFSATSCSSSRGAACRCRLGSPRSRGDDRARLPKLRGRVADGTGARARFPPAALSRNQGLSLTAVWEAQSLAGKGRHRAEVWD
jgi:hypothetical protein